MQLQAPSTKLIASIVMDPREDLAAERRRCEFDVPKLQDLLCGGRDKLERRAQLVDLLQKSGWGDKSKRHSLSREEEYVGALKGAFGIWEKLQDGSVTLDDGIIMRSLLDFPGGLELHIGMFIPTIRAQGTPEQQAKWLPPSYNLKIVGTYAQTELGHGTFVRGLETTATFDKAAQEFVLHSPTLTSTKWWPGGMGKTATHAVVMARLCIDGKDYGPHAYLVQLRDLVKHLPMPGIKVGDIGPKFGYGGVDNGYMSMDHVRIPRDQMFMKYSQVTEEGRYVAPPAANSKASYSTMVLIRADIVKGAGNVLARAVTIATRYSAVRRQTAPAKGERETQVLDYQNTAGTLLPLIANTYALHFMGESMMKMYKQFEVAREKGVFSSLPELHALSSGLKALCTWTAADGIEACRRTCGGHGYSKLSGLPSLFENYVQNVTWEGDNNVLCLQTARYLVKTLVLARASAGMGDKFTIEGSAAYLNGVAGELEQRCTAQGPACWMRPEVASAALRHVACRVAVEAVGTLQAATVQAAHGGAAAMPKGGLAFEGPAWNGSTLTMIKLARVHCFYVMHLNFVDRVAEEQQSGRMDAVMAGVLMQLAALLAASHIDANLGDYLIDGYMSGAQGAMAREAHLQLLRELRPNAVGLVDAFALEDYLLNSALGRADGDVYRALLEMAKASPLNATEEGPAWEGVLKPAMTQGPGGVTALSRL